MRKLRLRRYWGKILLFNLLLGIVPIILLSILSAWIASITVQRMSIENSMQANEQKRNRIEHMLRGADNSLTQFINSSFTHTAMNSSFVIDEFATIQEVKKELYRLQFYEFGITDMIFINYAQNWIVNNHGFNRLNNVEQDPIWTVYNESDRTSFWQVHDGNVHLVKKLPIHSISSHGLLIAEIPVYFIHQSLSQVKMSGINLLVDTNNLALAHADETLLLSDMSHEPFMQQIHNQEENSGHFISNWNGRQVVVVYLKSSYNQWTYISLLSLNEIYWQARTIGWITLFICLIMIGCILFISFKGTRKIYSPIQNLYNSVLDHSQLNVKTGKIDEIKQISDRFKYLLNNQSQLDKQMSQHMKHLRELFMIKMLQGTITYSEIQEQLELFGKQSGWIRSWNYHCIMVTQIDTLQGTRYEEKDVHLLMYAIHNMITEMIDSGDRLPPVILSGHHVTLIGSTQQRHEDFMVDVGTLAEKIMGTIENLLSLPISISISNPFSDLLDTSDAYKNALDILKYRIVRGEESIIVFDQSLAAERTHYTFPKHIIAELIAAVKALDEPTAGKWLDKYMEQISKMKLQDYQLSLVRLLMELIRDLQNSGKSVHGFFGTDHFLLQKALNLQATEEVKRWIMDDIIQPIIRTLRNEREETYQKISDKIILTLNHILQNEVDSELTLEACATILHYHPSYLKQVFKRETGMNISDYIAEYRLKIAKELLRSTELKVSEIAEKLKYTSSTNFIRYFKKMEGMTPGQYRNDHMSP